jgi:hypothetical protein
MKHSGCVIAGAAALLLAVTSGTQAASDRIIGEEDSPPPFLTGAFVSSSVLVREPDQAISDS